MVRIPLTAYGAEGRHTDGRWWLRYTGNAYGMRDLLIGGSGTSILIASGMNETLAVTVKVRPRWKRRAITILWSAATDRLCGPAVFGMALSAGSGSSDLYAYGNDEVLNAVVEAICFKQCATPIR